MRKCDSCNAETERAHSYCLTTAKVVLSEAYWRNQFRFATDIVRQFGGAEWALAVFSALISQVAGSATPGSSVRTAASFSPSTVPQRVGMPCAAPCRGSGAVDPEECVQFAAAAWEYVFGRWPANVQQPTVGDTCDFCAKKIYRGRLPARSRWG